MNRQIRHNRFATLDILFHKVLNKMKRIEQTPRHFGTSQLLYPSEIHTIETIGRNPGINVTRLAELQGVTKGAVSQVIRKLVTKEMVLRMRDEISDREVLLTLTPTGQTAYRAHEDFHARIYPELTHILDTADDAQMEFIKAVFTAVDRFCDKVLSEPPDLT